MTDYSGEGLGRAIRTRREAMGLTQQELGRKAGYRAGAGVSISRIETGGMRPSPAKLANIAEALGMKQRSLEAAARLCTEELAARRRTSNADADHDAANEVSLRERVERLNQALVHRHATVSELADAFNTAHDSARDAFFLPFVVTAGRVAGAPEPPAPEGLTEEHMADEGAIAQTAAAYRLQAMASGVYAGLERFAAGAAAGAAAGVAAYATFTAASALGAASTAISGLTGAAATNATWALLGGGSLAAGGLGMAGGTAVLAGIVALPAAAAALGGYLLMSRRSKQKRAALLEALDAAEDQLGQTQPGFDALVHALSSATDIMTYIAVHGGHACQRWIAGLGLEPIPWDELTDEQRQTYERFFEIAGCQLAVANIDLGTFMTERGHRLKAFSRATDEVLNQAKQTIEEYV